VLIWWYRHEDMIEMGNTQWKKEKEKKQNKIEFFINDFFSS
jgi:hypothetical protein